MAENEAEVSGLKTAIGGFPSPEQFAQYQVLTKLAPALCRRSSRPIPASSPRSSRPT